MENISSNEIEFVVTGANGFIGSHLKASLESAGNEVLPLDLPQHDLRDHESLHEVLPLELSGTIVHAATSSLKKFDYDVSVLKNNLAMISGLINRVDSQCNLVNLGSGSEYGRERWSDNIRESDFGTFIPQNDHEFSKYIIARLLENRKYTSNVRLFGIFGEGDSPVNKFVSNCLAKCLLGQDIKIYRDRLMSMIHVGDLGKFFSMYGRELNSVGSLNFGGPRGVLLSDIAYVCREISGSHSSNITVLNAGFARPYVANNDKFESLFPKFRWTSLEEGVSRVYNWIQTIMDAELTAEVLQDQYLNEAAKKDV